ncbi:MAG: hypothetical protein WBC02_11590, partial [Candidatus Aminicenantaceae bacterium]
MEKNYGKIRGKAGTPGETRTPDPLLRRHPIILIILLQMNELQHLLLKICHPFATIGDCLVVF